jgi:transcriptional regulator with XRE-family HTH domain
MPFGAARRYSYICVASAVRPKGTHAMTDRRERQVTGGFATRLRQVIDTYGSANSVAKAIERSEGAVRKWLRGESEPNVTDLRTLCEQTQTSIEWLVTGRGRREAIHSHLSEAPGPNSENAPHSPPLSYSLLEEIMDAIESEVRQQELTLPSSKRSMLVTTLYDMFHGSRKVDGEAVARLVKLAR